MGPKNDIILILIVALVLSVMKNVTVQDSDVMYFLDTLDMEYYEEDRD